LAAVVRAMKKKGDIRLETGPWSINLLFLYGKDVRRGGVKLENRKYLYNA